MAHGELSSPVMMLAQVFYNDVSEIANRVGDNGANSDHKQEPSDSEN